MSNDVPKVEHVREGDVGARLNVGALYGALDAERRARDMSWRQLAKEAGVSPSTMSRLGSGHRPDVDAFAKLVQWLGVPAERFFMDERATVAQPDLVSEVAPLLRARKDLSEQDVDYLEDLIGAAVRRFNAERKRS